MSKCLKRVEVVERSKRNSFPLLMRSCESFMKENPNKKKQKLIMLNPNHRLAELIILDFHTKLYHIPIKQTLAEVRQKF